MFFYVVPKDFTDVKLRILLSCIILDLNFAVEGDSVAEKMPIELSLLTGRFSTCASCFNEQTEFSPEGPNSVA